MKKIIVLLILASILVACKTSSGHCDAYGNKSGSIKTEKTIV